MSYIGRQLNLPASTVQLTAEGDGSMLGNRVSSRLMVM